MIYFTYVYFHDKTPIYVGMGKGNRHLYHLNQVSKGKPLDNPYLENKLKKLLNENTLPRIEKVLTSVSEQEAKHMEKQLIQKYGRADLGRGPLTNLTDGGDGRCGWSEEQRAKMSAVHKGRISVKDKYGNVFKTSKQDPRILSGELVGQNAGISFSDTSKFRGMTIAIDETGKSVRVSKDDPRWLIGKLKGINTGKSWSDSAKDKMRASLKANPNTGAPKKPCTVDGITIYPSYSALAKALGRGKNGTNHPNFRYLS